MKPLLVCLATTGCMAFFYFVLDQPVSASIIGILGILHLHYLRKEEPHMLFDGVLLRVLVIDAQSPFGGEMLARFFTSAGHEGTYITGLTAITDAKNLKPDRIVVEPAGIPGDWDTAVALQAIAPTTIFTTYWPDKYPEGITSKVTAVFTKPMFVQELIRRVIIGG